MKYLTYVVLFCMIITGQIIAKPIKNEKQLIKDAKIFIQKLIKLEKQYDPRIGQFYEDDADIIITRLYPGGLKKTKKFSGKQMREYLDENVMKYKNERGESIEYSKFEYHVVDSYTVKVTMLRKQKDKKEAHPYLLVVGLNKKNEWKIFTENIIVEPL